MMALAGRLALLLVLLGLVQHVASKPRVAIDCLDSSYELIWADTIRADSFAIGAYSRVRGELRHVLVYHLQWNSGMLVRHCDRIRADTL